MVIASCFVCHFGPSKQLAATPSAPQSLQEPAAAALEGGASGGPAGGCCAGHCHVQGKASALHMLLFEYAMLMMMLCWASPCSRQALFPPLSSSAHVCDELLWLPAALWPCNNHIWLVCLCRAARAAPLSYHDHVQLRILFLPAGDGRPLPVSHALRPCQGGQLVLHWPRLWCGVQHSACWPQLAPGTASAACGGHLLAAAALHGRIATGECASSTAVTFLVSLLPLIARAGGRDCA